MNKKTLGSILLLGFINHFDGVASKANAESNHYQDASNLEERAEIDFDKVDSYYWKYYEFYQYGGRWHVMDNIAVRIENVFLDSLINPLNPAPPETKRYYLVVKASFRALKGSETIDPSNDFGIIDAERSETGKRQIRVGDYEGKYINRDIKRGMYNKLNPGKLKYPINLSYGPEDEIKIGAAREPAWGNTRKIPFAIAEDWPTGHLPVGSKRRYESYLQGLIWFCYNNQKIQIYNFDRAEGIYKAKK